MGQVPNTNFHFTQIGTHIGIVGNGKAAKHLSFYFESMGYPVFKWNRRLPESDLKKLSACKVILLAIPDSQIDEFLAKRLLPAQSEVLHLSGALTTSIRSLHPLVSFGPTYFDLNFYKEISFVTESEYPFDFKSYFPNLPNPVFKIPRRLKSKYHAYCVAANNFTTMLWQEYFNTLQNEFGISPKAANILLKSTFENINSDWKNALTGPFVRGDHETIEKNLASLRGDSLQKIYQAFRDSFTDRKERIDYVYLDPGEIVL